MRRIAIVTLAATVLCLGGCDQGGSGGDGTGNATAASSAAASKDGKKGMADPSNDKAVVAMAKKVLPCKWGKYGFDSKCEALKSWKKSDALKGGKADATLVNFLEDGDVKVQWLGADGLARRGQAYRKDKAMATKVIDVADKATEERLMKPLGKAVGNIDLNATGLVERVKKMLESHGNTQLRRTLAGNTLFRNRDVPGMFDLFVKLAKSDKDKKVRKAAAAAFWTGTPSGKQEDVCKLWLELAGDEDHDLAGHSAYHCAFKSSGGGCSAQWDDLLSLIESKAKAGEVQSSFMASALEYFHGQKKASDEQKKRAVAIAKKLVENKKNDASARASSLEFVGKEDPKGKVFAAKYENDDEFFVKNAAKRVKKGK